MMARDKTVAFTIAHLSNCDRRLQPNLMHGLANVGDLVGLHAPAGIADADLRDLDGALTRRPRPVLTVFHVIIHHVDPLASEDWRPHIRYVVETGIARCRLQ